VIATTHYQDPKVLAEVSEQMTGAMKGLAIGNIPEADCCRLAAGNSLELRKQGRGFGRALSPSRCSG